LSHGNRQAARGCRHRRHGLDRRHHGEGTHRCGLRVVALERGPDRDTQPDFAYPRVADELAGSVHRKFLQSLSKETVTARHGLKDTAVPYRQIGSFKPGTGVGGAGRIGRAAISARCPRISICEAMSGSATERSSSPTA
jgi:hypothetical protein